MVSDGVRRFRRRVNRRRICTCVQILMLFFTQDRHLISILWLCGDCYVPGILHTRDRLVGLYKISAYSTRLSVPRLALRKVWQGALLVLSVEWHCRWRIKRKKVDDSEWQDDVYIRGISSDAYTYAKRVLNLQQSRSRNRVDVGLQEQSRFNYHDTARKRSRLTGNIKEWSNSLV